MWRALNLINDDGKIEAKKVLKFVSLLVPFTAYNITFSSRYLTIPKKIIKRICEEMKKDFFNTNFLSTFLFFYSHEKE